MSDLDPRYEPWVFEDSALGVLKQIVDWWNHLPPKLRQDIEGSGNVPGCISRAMTVIKARSNG